MKNKLHTSLFMEEIDAANHFFIQTHLGTQPLTTGPDLCVLANGLLLKSPMPLPLRVRFLVKPPDHFLFFVFLCASMTFLIQTSLYVIKDVNFRCVLLQGDSIRLGDVPRRRNVVERMADGENPRMNE